MSYYHYFSYLLCNSLVRAIRSERKLIKAFEELGFTPKEAIDIISYPALSKTDQYDDATIEEVYDVRDDPEANFITWWNDLEKDSRYTGWSSDIKEVSHHTYDLSVMLTDVLAH